MYNGQQLDTAYDQTLGTYQPGTYTFNIFGNKAPSDPLFKTFGLTIYFTDGTYISASTPGTIVSPPVTTQPSVTVTSPNGGETLTVGNNIVVSWNANGAESFPATILELADLNGGIVSSARVNPVSGAQKSDALTTNGVAVGKYLVKVCLSGNIDICDSSDNPFSIVAPAINQPTIKSISPASGPTTGGTVVTITGTGFASGTIVTIGGVAATNVNVVSSTSITATTPAANYGTADVAVISANSTATLPGGFTFTQILVSAPTITGISPNTGPTTGGTVVTITGTNFVSGNTTITFGGASWPWGQGTATNVTVNSSGTSITATTPAMNANNTAVVDVEVTNAASTATLTGGFTFVVPVTSLNISQNSLASISDAITKLAQEVQSLTK